MQACQTIIFSPFFLRLSQHLTCQMVGFGYDSIPLVNLYAQDLLESLPESSGEDVEPRYSEPVLVNRLLVDQGLAQWVDQQPMLVEVAPEQQQQQEEGEAAPTS